MGKTDLDSVLFGKTTFSNLLEKIYKNSISKEKKIREVIDHLKSTINNPQEATLVVPLLKEFMDIGVKNDELLIKMAGIAQRAITSNDKNDNDDYNLTDKEKEDLFKLMDESKPKVSNEL